MVLVARIDVLGDDDPSHEINLGWQICHIEEETLTLVSA
jgi:hypothetical protein